MATDREPTPEEIHRYAVAWGESQLVHLTDWRYWEEIYGVALEMIRLQSIEIENLKEENQQLILDVLAAKETK